MPKMRTKRAMAKRFKATASGKLKRGKMGLRHILTKKSSDSKRKKRSTAYVHRADMKLVTKCLPYI